jgi:hypothetical protein
MAKQRQIDSFFMELIVSYGKASSDILVTFYLLDLLPLQIEINFVLTHTIRFHAIRFHHVLFYLALNFIPERDGFSYEVRLLKLIVTILVRWSLSFEIWVKSLSLKQTDF